MAFDDRHMERNALLLVGAVTLGIALPAYTKVTEKLAARGVELSVLGHVGMFALSAVMAALVFAILVLGLGLIVWCFAGLARAVQSVMRHF